MLDADPVTKAVAGQDAVVVTLGIPDNPFRVRLTRRASDLDWTIIRPVVLHDEVGAGPGGGEDGRHGRSHAGVAAPSGAGGGGRSGPRRVDRAGAQRLGVRAAYPVVEEVAQRPSRNLRREVWDSTEIPSPTLRGFDTLAALAAQPPGGLASALLGCRHDHAYRWAGTGVKAVVGDRYGSPDVLRVEEVPVPSPGAGQVRLKVAATSVNLSDWEALRGAPAYARIGGLRAPRHRTLGSDIAGVVDDVGQGVTDFGSETRSTVTTSRCLVASRSTRSHRSPHSPTSLPSSRFRRPRPSRRRARSR